MPNKAYELIDWIYEKHVFVCHGRKKLEKIVHGTASFQTQNYHFSNIDKITHLSEVKIVLFVVSIA